MTRLINLLRNVAFPLGIAVALTFGATQTVGQIRALDSCPWFPPYHLGECQSETQCQNDCDGYGAPDYVCDQNNCCGCLFK
jgi:hypothetical protein